jgi:precorrin-6B methylase 2
MFEYTFTTKWKPNNYTEITRSRTVRFKAGVTAIVDLTKEDPKDRAKIRFVPTPEDIVAAMIDLAGVTANDVVFEPGCGDARILLYAMKAGARRGVGIDIDPERVTESRANVKTAGMEGKVEIRLGDALDIKDLSDASVVFLYMGDEFDMLLRPHLWRQLKVGARVVSHRFTMGDWKPDKSVYVPGWDEGEYQLHLWTITKEIKERAAKEAATAAK